MDRKYGETVNYLLDAAREVALGVDTSKLAELADLILSKRTIFIYGSGRSGLVGQYFSVRLVQMGLDVHFVGEMTTPIIGKEDLTILISNTGETMSAVQTANIARRIGSHVVCITGSPGSKLAAASNTVIVLDASRLHDGRYTPLGTLFEDSAVVMFDSLIPALMDRKGTDEDEMRHRHAIWV